MLVAKRFNILMDLTVRGKLFHFQCVSTYISIGCLVCVCKLIKNCFQDWQAFFATLAIIFNYPDFESLKQRAIAQI